MPILTLEANKFTQVCAICNTERELATADLVLGATPNRRVIVAPPCACGAQEMFLPDVSHVPEEESPRHRLAVNTLATMLKEQRKGPKDADFRESFDELDTVSLKQPFKVKR